MLCFELLLSYWVLCGLSYRGRTEEAGRGGGGEHSSWCGSTRRSAVELVHTAPAWLPLLWFDGARKAEEAHTTTVMWGRDVSHAFCHPQWRHEAVEVVVERTSPVGNAPT